MDSPEILENASSQMSVQVPWDDGNEEDFGDLHKAIQEGRTKKYQTDNQSYGGSSSESEEEKEPSLDDKGNRLLWLAQHGRVEELEAILEDQPDLISFKDNDGYSALHRAAYSNQAETLIILLRRGADIHALTDEEWHPLHSACRWNASSCVEILLNQGANVNAQTRGCQTPLHLAAFSGNSRSTLELLLMHPYIQPDVKNCQQDTAKDIALRNKNSPELFDLTLPHFRMTLS